MHKRHPFYVLILAALLLTAALTSCGVYSFSGISLSPDVKTISIKNFTNETGLGSTRLSQNFTEQLKDYFLRNTTLRLVKSDGDIQFEGQIVGYTLSPVGTQQATQQYQIGQSNRLTISVKVRFTNTKDDTQSFDKNFSTMEDFPSSQTIGNEDSQKVDEMLDRMTLDIFNASVTNW